MFGWSFFFFFFSNLGEGVFGVEKKKGLVRTESGKGRRKPLGPLSGFSFFPPFFLVTGRQDCVWQMAIQLTISFHFFWLASSEAYVRGGPPRVKTRFMTFSLYIWGIFSPCSCDIEWKGRGGQDFRGEMTTPRGLECGHATQTQDGAAVSACCKGGRDIWALYYFCCLQRDWGRELGVACYREDIFLRWWTARHVQKTSLSLGAFFQSKCLKFLFSRSLPGPSTAPTGIVSHFLSVITCPCRKNKSSSHVCSLFCACLFFVSPTPSSFCAQNCSASRVYSAFPSLSDIFGNLKSMIWIAGCIN